MGSGNRSKLAALANPHQGSIGCGIVIKDFFGGKMWAGASVMRADKVKDNIALEGSKSSEVGESGGIGERAELVAVAFSEVARTHGTAGLGKNGIRSGGIVCSISDAELPLTAAFYRGHVVRRRR